MPDSNSPLPANISRLIPLTPAVFYVLLALSSGPRHGYAVMQETTRLSEGGFRMGPATLYTTVQRLMDLDLIAEVHAKPGDDSRRRCYELTGLGVRLLRYEIERSNAVLKRATRLVQRHTES